MAQRQPLQPCDPNRGIKQELTPTLRAQISAYKAVGLTNEQIGARVFCAPTTIAYALRQNAHRDDFKSLSRAGRPPLLSRRDRRLILRIIRVNPKITYNVLKLEAPVQVSRSTLYRMLKKVLRIG
jgi:IS30 family transposase